jgi:asparagine synthase (glutamine-hydrolysing)
MCGISGIINFNGLDLDSSTKRLNTMLNTLSHRGPDGHGTYVKEKVAIGMQRLAIIDLNTGQQPFSDSSGRYTIVFNGELYNYKELKLVLEGLGYKFKSTSDTEVLLYSYIEFGKRCVEYLNGMYAFTIWDSEEELLFGARDPFGIKPFYYAEPDKNSFIFASELQALLSAELVPRQIDLPALSHYLSFEYIPCPLSAIRGVFKLPPAYRFVLSRHGFQSERFWKASFSRSESRPPTIIDDYIDDLEKGIERAIELENYAEVKHGVFLSGGLDSSTIAYYTAKQARKLGQELPTCYSVKFSEPSFDESPYAEAVSKKLNLPHKILTLNETDLLNGISIATEKLDEPMGDSSFVPTYLLAKFARQDVAMVLGGDGSDELFAGYQTYQAHSLVELYERLLPRTIRATIIPWLINLMPSSDKYLSIDFKLKRFLSGRGLPIEKRHHNWLGSFTPIEQFDLLHPSRRLLELDSYEPARFHYEESGAKYATNKILYCDMQLYLEGCILTKVDRATMLNSLEARVPFLNKQLANFILEVPFEFKMKHFKTKRLLRKLMKDKLPSSVLNRPKQGFGFPVGKMLKGVMKPRIQEVFDPVKLEQQKIFNPKAVQTILDNHWSGKVDLRKQIWTLLMYQTWFDRTIKLP